jgi:hypothetical protein
MTDMGLLSLCEFLLQPKEGVFNGTVSIQLFIEQHQ